MTLNFGKCRYISKAWFDDKLKSNIPIGNRYWWYFEAMHYNMLNLNVLCGILGIDASWGNSPWHISHGMIILFWNYLIVEITRKLGAWFLGTIIQKLGAMYNIVIEFCSGYPLKIKLFYVFQVRFDEWSQIENKYRHISFNIMWVSSCMEVIQILQMNKH